MAEDCLFVVVRGFCINLRRLIIQGESGHHPLFFMSVVFDHLVCLKFGSSDIQVLL